MVAPLTLMPPPEPVMDMAEPLTFFSVPGPLMLPPLMVKVPWPLTSESVPVSARVPVLCTRLPPQLTVPAPTPS